MWLLMSLCEMILINDIILTCFMVEGRKAGRGREMEREGGGERQWNNTILECRTGSNLRAHLI